MAESVYGEILQKGRLKELLKIIEELAIEAGEVIYSGFRKAKKIENKSDRDFVTDTDQQSERLILGRLRELFPTHCFIGEEETAKAGGVFPELTDAPTWFCDPLDGTTNFVHTFPFVCVCIGLSVEKEVVLGVVHAPILDETFCAAKGLGSTLNGQKLRVNDETNFQRALVITELGPDRREQTLNSWMARFRAVAENARTIRCTGSCALAMSGVACGRADAFYEIGFGGPWDCAAAAIIVTEAGGTVFDPSGHSFEIMSRRVACASSPAIEAALVHCLKPHSFNPDEPKYPSK